MIFFESLSPAHGHGNQHARRRAVQVDQRMPAAVRLVAERVAICAGRGAGVGLVRVDVRVVPVARFAGKAAVGVRPPSKDDPERILVSPRTQLLISRSLGSASQRLKNTADGNSYPAPSKTNAPLAEW